MQEYEKDLEQSATEWRNPTFYNNSKRFVYYIRAWFYNKVFMHHFKLDQRHKFWLPGFEMKVACESAERNGS